MNCWNKNSMFKQTISLRKITRSIRLASTNRCLEKSRKFLFIAGSKSEKFKLIDWVGHQEHKIAQLNEPAQKFQQQLQRLFAQE
jgi:hypothetical protein